MKQKIFSILLLTFLLTNNFIHAQVSWCIPNTAIPYTADMPGITNVTINTINRTSLPIENYPNNSYVNTGLSTTFISGHTYTISITHTRDSVLFPLVRNNIRVWIDFNHDGSLDDPGETVVSLDHETAGISTATFTIPSTVIAGTTRMRVTVKMSDEGGHTLPTPCDFPADPIGYHGEMEDYDAVIQSTTGITDLDNSKQLISVFPNPAAESINVNFSKNEIDEFKIINVLGEIILNGVLSATENSIDVSSIANGIYSIELINKNGIQTKQFFKN